MANTVELKGFAEFDAKLKGAEAKILQRAAAVVKDSGLLWVRLAKRSAPKDQGRISGAISSISTGTTAEVVSPTKYSRFVEFGTKRKKQVPSELVAYEKSLGYEKSGDYYDFLNNILDWVKRKGIHGVVNSYTGKTVKTKENLIVLAQAIANSIMRHGIKPQPFFFIHKPEVEKHLLTEAGKFLKKEL